EYRILVDITNSVLAHLDREGMVSAIAADIHRYFAIPCVSLAFFDGGNAEAFPVTACGWQGENQYVCQQRTYPVAQSIIKHVLDNSLPQAVALNENLNDPLLKDLYSAGMQAALLLPLTFNAHSPGVFIL
ncbi:formate hydrogenlyase, partial [Enterobacter bugandensis]